MAAPRRDDSKGERRLRRGAAHTPSGQIRWLAQRLCLCVVITPGIGGRVTNHKLVEDELARMRELEQSIQQQLAELRELTERARLLLDGEKAHSAS